MDTLGTIVVGVAIFVTGQLLIKFLVEPAYQLRLLFGQILHALTYYINSTDRPELQSATTNREGMQAYRDLAAQLEQRVYAVPLYRFWSRIFRRSLPPPQDIRRAANNLIGLSNSLNEGERATRATEIRRSLRLHLPGDPRP